MFGCPLPPDAELRLLQAHDAETMFALIERNRHRLDIWMLWTTRIRSIEDNRAYIQRMLNKYANNDGFHAGIWLNGTLVGGAACRGINWDSRDTEIGYWLTEEATGQGLATRAAKAMMTYLFDELGMNRIQIVAVAENTPSRKIAERIGFKLEGLMREAVWLDNQFKDEAMYSMLAREWRELKANGRS